MAAGFSRQGIAQALQGFGAGIAGRGSEFIAGLDATRKQALLDDAFTIQRQLQQGDVSSARSVLNDRLAHIQKLGGDPSDTFGVLQKLDSGDLAGALTDVSTVVEFAQAQGLLKAPGAAVGAGQREFESLIKDFSEEEKKKARRVKARITPGAIGSAVQTITQEGIAEDIAETEATIAQRKKFAEMTGSSRSQAIDKGFDKVQKLSKNISNIDAAIDAVQAGAGTGVIAKRFPSIRGSSILLDQVQGALALDVIGSVTFGALSEGELALAKEIAIPTGLEGPELVTWLQDRKSAQTKLLDYFQDQIDFLDQGGSVAGFLRSKRRQPTPATTTTDSPPAAGEVLQFDAQGNQIR